jgi:hypothetical protein
MCHGAQRAAANGEAIQFPARLLSASNEPTPAFPIPIDFQRLYPKQTCNDQASLLRQQHEDADKLQALAAATHSIAHLRDTLAWREHQLAEKGLKRKAARLGDKLRKLAGRLGGRAEAHSEKPPERKAA